MSVGLFRTASPVLKFQTSVIKGRLSQLPTNLIVRRAHNLPQAPNLRSAATTTFSTSEVNAAKGWRKYADQFRSKPVSHIVSFAILHEITAVIPVVGVYYFLDITGMRIPIPQIALEHSNKILSKLRGRVGLEPLSSDSRAVVNLAASYAIVKAIMPLRIAACFALTPWFARSVIHPCTNVVKRIKNFGLAK
ncbi:hypothetical protein K7432_013932 [Basidiobolus ranarum]|uniref:DUF1279 domain-containing protein n=1 Tax=Basidiobolus ranarum TaxID=34480 RepID=A0ABR2VQ93_9FUNG